MKEWKSIKFSLTASSASDHESLQFTEIDNYIVYMYTCISFSSDLKDAKKLDYRKGTIRLNSNQIKTNIIIHIWTCDLTPTVSGEWKKFGAKFFHSLLSKVICYRCIIFHNHSACYAFLKASGFKSSRNILDIRPK